MERFQLKYDEKIWLMDVESSQKISGLIDNLFSDNMNRKTKDEVLDLRDLFDYMKQMNVEIIGDEVWLKAEKETGEEIRHLFKELSIILSASFETNDEAEYINFLITQGKVMASSNSEDELLKDIVCVRKCICGFCKKEVTVKSLKYADDFLMLEPRALMEIPKEWELDYLLEVHDGEDGCGYANRDITIEPTAKEREAMKDGIKEIIPNISDEVPATVKSLHQYAMFAFFERNYRLSLLLLMYAYDYYHSCFNILDRDLSIRCALENVCYESIKELHLMRMDIMRRTGWCLPYKEYDSYDFSGAYDFQEKFDGSCRQREADYLLNLARQGDRRKRTWCKFEEFYPSSKAREFYVECEDFSKIREGSKTILLKSENLETPDAVEVGDCVVCFNDEMELLCRVKNIEDELSIELLLEQIADSGDKEQLKEKVFTLEIL